MGRASDPLRGGAITTPYLNGKCAVRPYDPFKDNALDGGALGMSDQEKAPGLEHHSDSGSYDSDSSENSTERRSPKGVCGTVRNGSSDHAVTVMSANVTALTEARLEQVLEVALNRNAVVIALQETRHPSGGFGWAEHVAARAGFRTQWSADAGLDAAGRRHPWGTALLWRETLGRSQQLPSDSHRSTGRRWAGFSVWSVYGLASRADTQWFTQSLSQALNADAFLAWP